jgi:apolipoprotein N-acyltransferase
MGNLPGIFIFSLFGLFMLSAVLLLISNGICSARRKDEERKAVSAELIRLDEAKKERRKCLH